MIIEFATHPITELLAIFSFAFYVFLCAKGKIWCWGLGFVTSLLYTFIFMGVYLPSQVFLNILYMIMAVWGWAEWSQVKQDNQISAFRYCKKVTHIWICVAIIAASFLLVQVLPGAFVHPQPALDALVTVAGIAATLLTIYRRIESWIYWVVINGVNAVLFYDQKLDQTALFSAGLVLVSVYGYFNWKKLRELKAESYD